jgi:glucose-6-phosphate isomerase
MITAARLGTSPLLLDWNGLQNFTKPEISDSLQKAWTTCLKKLNEEVSGFYNAVVKPELSQVNASIELAKKFTQNPSITDCLFIGIGGSSLGPMCLIDSLKHRATSKIQFHFFENPDPIDWNYRIKKLNPASTVVCVVTKSGTTYETLSLFMLAFSWLKNSVGAAKASEQTVAITDPEKGELLEFSKKNNLATLSIAPAIGGRFSVFSPVGLFAGALAGLDMNAFILGGKKIRDYCEKATNEKNLFATWAGAVMALEKTHPVHVMMPYSTSLRLVANWWVQIWAESLGKAGRGFTPLPCLGAIDQHSMLQLLRDGPNDKMMWFLNIQDFGVKATVPSVDFRVKTFDLLEGQELGSVLDTEFRAVQRVMTNQKRPHLQVQLDSLNEEAFGALLFTFCMLTAYMGDVMGLNPFDQPGVEEAKIYIRESLIQKKEAAKNLAATAQDQDETHRLRLHRE